MDINFYEMRVDQVKDAASRSRWVLIASLVLAGALIAALWNALPWGLYEAAADAWGKGGTFDQSDELTKIMKAELLKGWIQSLFITVPALGIRFSVFDGSILGGLAFGVLAVWRFFSSRRENFLIGDLLADASNESVRIRSFVYHGVIGSQVFVTVTLDDDPIRTLNDARRSAEGKRTSYARDLSRLLAYLPVFALGLSMATDIYSIFWINQPFTSTHDKIGYDGIEGGDYGAFAVAVLLFGLVFHLSFRANQYQRGTQALLRHARQEGWGKIEIGPDPDKAATPLA